MNKLVIAFSLLVMFLVGCGSINSAKEVAVSADVNALTMNRVGTESYSPDVTYISEEELSTQGRLKDIGSHRHNNNVSVERSYTFRSGETILFSTQGNYVYMSDMNVGKINKFKKGLRDFEKHLKDNNISADTLETQGAIGAEYCQLYFWWCWWVSGKKWPNSTMYVEPPSAALFSRNERNQISAAINYINNVTDLNIVYSSTQYDRVYFAKDNDGTGCDSEVGLSGGRQRINMRSNSRCFNSVNFRGFDGSIAHELLHAAGLVHEHQRPDRGAYLFVSRNDSTTEPYTWSEIRLNNAYDYGSIMHVGENSGVRRALSNYQPYANLGQRNGLSPLDIQLINSYY